MPRAYLYLSTAKLDQLIEQSSNFLSSLTAKLEFKVPFVSGGLSAANSAKNIARLESVEKKLRKQYSIPRFDEIPPDSSPVFIEFAGRAVRGVQAGQFWLAVDHPHTALLLAGSASFAMGQQQEKPGGLFSPSADPVGAFVRAFGESNKGESDRGIAGDLSYLWSAMMEEPLRSHAVLPTVEGLAIFATTVAAKGSFGRVRRPDIRDIVVGTPLYVRQVEAQQAPAPSPEQKRIAGRKRFIVQVSTVREVSEKKPRLICDIEALAYQLHCRGYQVSEGGAYNSDYFLTALRDSDRWNRAFILYRPEMRALAEEINSFLREQGVVPSELLGIEEAVNENGPMNESLMEDNVDVAVAICS